MTKNINKDTFCLVLTAAMWLVEEYCSRIDLFLPVNSPNFSSSIF